MTTPSAPAAPEEATTAMVEQLRRLRVVPVVVIADPEHAAPLGGALSEGGIRCAEITFRTASAPESLRRIAEAHPDLLVGAGTVLTPQQAAAARDAGARFVVSPGFNPRVVDYCQDHGIPIFPGVCTPTEIEAALEKDLKVLKFFPAEPMGGVSFLKAIAAPYPGVQFIPTGGIGPEQLSGYLALPEVVACGGSWLAPSSRIAAGEFDWIREEVRRTTSVLAILRGSAGEDGR